MQRGLSHLRVIDFTSGIAGGYCTKLLADAGADVIKVEPIGGDPLRTWTSSHTDLRGEDGALFRFLAHGKRSVIGAPGDASIEDLVRTADVVVEAWTSAEAERYDYARRFPGLVVLAITPYGRGGPLSDRPTTEFIVQAESGGLVGRGGPDQVPIQAGGRISEWVGATFAAVAVSAAAWRATHTGHGEYIDFSTAATMTIAGGNYSNLIWALGGAPPITTVHRTFETPSVEPTLDGYVGFCTNSRQQFDDFLLLIERPDLLGDEELARAPGRQKHWDRWNKIVHEWTPRFTTEDIVRRASELRIPVAPVHSGANVMDCEQFVARGVYIDDPTGSFKMPRRPWSIDGEDPPPPRPAPRAGEHTGQIATRAPARPAGATEAKALPLDGVRVLDLTAWWAGPIAAGMIAALGADVIHVESTSRPDGMRMTGAMFGMEGPWWERSGHYLASNTNKRGLTLDLTTPRGLDLLKELIKESDAIIENFTPRVMANFGLDWATIQAINPRCTLVRMPAFGLSGPWRDNTGFAQTMEQVTGLAWVTGHPWDQPRIQRGPSDPNAGMHAAFALIVGLAERDVTGRGHHFEVTMVEGALCAAVEIALEYSAYGAVLERDGNHSPNAAPQGLYPCAGWENWLTISIETDDQWQALRRALGDPQWAHDRALSSIEGRRAAQDRIDEHLAEWARERDVADAARLLIDHGVPAAAGVDPRLTTDHPQLVARKFYEFVDHPVVGAQPLPTVPFRFASVDHWLRAPAPLLGEHNEAILCGLLGLSRAEFDQLTVDGIIGNRPKELMNRPLRAVVVGTSFGGRVHVPALQAAGFEVVAIVGRDLERTRTRARDLGVAHAFTSIDEALALPDIDAVTVSTPPDADTAPVLAAIAQGKHVLCEKPFALNAQDGQAMYDAATAAGIVHMCAFEFRWRPEEAVAKRAIDGGFLGSVEFATCVQITALVAGGVHKAFNEEWWFDRDRGGGILNASGSHYIDRFRMWFGEVEAVSARLQIVGDHSADDAEDTYTMTLRMTSGATALIQQCSASWGESFRTIRAVGDRGSVWVDRDSAFMATSSGTRELDVPDDLQLPPEPPRRPDDPKHAFTFMELPGFTRLAERFRDAIRAADPHFIPHVGAPPSPTFRDALMVQRAIDAARESSNHDGAWVTVEQLPQ